MYKNERVVAGLVVGGGGRAVRQWDPAEPVVETVPSSHPDAPRYDPKVDPDLVLADAPRRDGVPVDHRTGEPLLLERADGQRGWHMSWDQQGQRWLAENQGRGGAPEMIDVRATEPVRRRSTRWRTRCCGKVGLRRNDD